jgi:uncharacterized membrane protein YcaP (DUF421 family)
MDIVLRAICAYLFILFLMRITGRRELSSMEPSDLILLVVMGDLIQNGVTQSDYSVTGVLLAVSTFGLLAVATSYLAFRFRRVEQVVEGEPLILVEDGQVIEKNLRAERLTLQELAEQARGQQIERLEDVKWAVLETSGTITFIPKSQS